MYTFGVQADRLKEEKEAALNLHGTQAEVAQQLVTSQQKLAQVNRPSPLSLSASSAAFDCFLSASPYTFVPLRPNLSS